jgi:hypothetical protein
MLTPLQIQLRFQFLPKFQDALQSVKASRFFQLGIAASACIMDLQLACAIPLVEQ